MCDPMTMIGIGLSAAGQVAGFAGEQSATNDYNAAAKQNAINASVAATRKYQDEQASMIADAKQDNREGFSAIMKTREAKGQAIASAGSSGLDLGSISVKSVLADLANDEADAEYVMSDRAEGRETSYRSHVKSYEAEAQGRINSMPFKKGPSPLGLALGIATSAAGNIANSPTATQKVNSWFGG